MHTLGVERALKLRHQARGDARELVKRGRGLSTLKGMEEKGRTPLPSDTTSALGLSTPQRPLPSPLAQDRVFFSMWLLPLLDSICFLCMYLIMSQKKSSSQTAPAQKWRWHRPVMLRNLYKMEISPTALKLRKPRYASFPLLFRTAVRVDILAQQHRLNVLLGGPSSQLGGHQVESSILVYISQYQPGHHMRQALPLSNKYTYSLSHCFSGWDWRTHGDKNADP